MRLAFAGTAPFAATILERLIASDHDVATVYTQPDRAGVSQAVGAGAGSPMRSHR